jgi:hypothetical protein
VAMMDGTDNARPVLGQHIFGNGKDNVGFRSEAVKKSYDGLPRPSPAPFDGLGRPSYFPYTPPSQFFHSLSAKARLIAERKATTCQSFFSRVLILLRRVVARDNQSLVPKLRLGTPFSRNSASKAFPKCQAELGGPCVTKRSLVTSCPGKVYDKCSSQPCAVVLRDYPKATL